MNKIKTLVIVFIAIAFFLLNPINLFSQVTTFLNTNSATKLKVINNPIIPGQGVCDPHIHIFNNKAYLFASHDEQPGNTSYTMNDWWLWSSPDLVNWTKEFTLKPEDTYVGAWKKCYAADGATRNGKFYFYFSKWSQNTGVAVSTNNPAGPYKDALGKELNGGWDPTVYIDDDANKTPYIIYGSFPYKIARLNEDMISMAEEPKELTYVDREKDWTKSSDGNFIHKHNGIYYLNQHGQQYGTSTNIYGPYTYRGKYYPSWHDHGTFFVWNNQDYVAYGLQDIDNFFRKTNITYVNYKENGDIVADTEVGQSHVGVGQYDCSKNIQAERYYAASDGTYKKEGGSGFVVSNLVNNSYLYYQRLLNVAEDASISVSVSSTGDKGIIEVRQDKTNGALLGTIIIPNTGNMATYQTASSKLKCKAGLQNIYLVFKGKKINANIDWITVASTAAIPAPPKVKPIIKPCLPSPTALAVSAFQQIEAESYVCSSSVLPEDCQDTGAGKNLGYIQNQSNCAYKVDFGQKNSDSLVFLARVASSNSKGGNIEIRLDSISGSLLGTCKITNTNGWQNWTTQECKIKAVSGVYNLFLVFKGGEEFLFNLNWVKFE